MAESSIRQTLPFLYSPRQTLAGEAERVNPHAKETTFQPDVVAALEERFGDSVGAVSLYAGEHTVYLDREVLVEACRFLRDEQGFDFVSDLATVDRFTDDGRFEVVYNLVSIAGRKRLRLKVRLEESDPTVPSITGVYPAAEWHEREAWDMMGIHFAGAPDLRRVFMPEDFAYHPARKDFPILGIPGSLPLPPNVTDGALQLDPFPRAHGELPKD
jgi:NADH-quinone oxidoreductase subunit C